MGCRVREKGREGREMGGARERMLGFTRKQLDGILKEGATKPLCVLCVSTSGCIWGQESAFLVTGEFKHGGLFSWQLGGMVWRGSGGLDALFPPQC